MNHTLSDSQLEAMIKSAVNSSGPLPPDEKFSQLVSALRELQERRKADSEPVAALKLPPKLSNDRERAHELNTGVDIWNRCIDEVAKINGEMIIVGRVDGLHPSTMALVNDFATALAEKLHKAELKYGYSNAWTNNGWMTECLAEFHRHIAKGDPRDVAAYCAFMWYHGWKTEAAQPAPERDQVRIAHAEWSQATFGNVGPVGPLKHLSKEALEAAAEPDDLSEWADMQFLLWDAQRRAGITDEKITQAMIEKLAVNKQREWPEPKDGEPRLHINEQPALTGNSPIIGIDLASGPDRTVEVRYVAPPGYVMVPKVATEKMLIAGLEEADPLGSLIDWDASRGDCNTREQVQGMFEAMLAAAQQEVKP